MNSDKEKAFKAKGIAEVRIRNMDYKGARDMISRAIKLFPEMDNASAMLAVCNVLCSGEIDFPSYGVDWYFILQLPPSAEDIEVKATCQQLVTRLEPIKDTFAGAKTALEFIQKAETVLCDGAYRSEFDRKRKKQRNAFGNDPSKKTVVRTNKKSNSETILSLRGKIHKMYKEEIVEKAHIVENWRKRGYLRRQEVPLRYNIDEDGVDGFDMFSQDVVKMYPNLFKEFEQHPDYNGILSGDVLGDDILNKALWNTFIVLVEKVANTTKDTLNKILENYWCELEGLERFGFDMLILGCRLQALQNIKMSIADNKKCLEQQHMGFIRLKEEVNNIFVEEEEQQEKLRLCEENVMQLREEVEEMKVLLYEKKQALKFAMDEKNVLGKEISQMREMIATRKEAMKRNENEVKINEKVKLDLLHQLNAYGR